MLCKQCGSYFDRPEGARRVFCSPCKAVRVHVSALKAQKKYCENHPDRRAQCFKNFYEANKEREKERAKLWRSENKEQAKAAAKRWREQNADAYVEMKKRWRNENKDLLKVRRQKQYQENKERENVLSRAYKIANKEILSAKQSAFLKAHPEINRYRVGLYRAAQKRATPIWADKEKIKSIYEEAVILTRTTGVMHEVDHIYPLQSDWCCGLHVEQNLRVVLASENRSKGNRRTADHL